MGVSLITPNKKFEKVYYMEIPYTVTEEELKYYNEENETEHTKESLEQLYYNVEMEFWKTAFIPKLEKKLEQIGFTEKDNKEAIRGFGYSDYNTKAIATSPTYTVCYTSSYYGDDWVVGIVRNDDTEIFGNDYYDYEEDKWDDNTPFPTEENFNQVNNVVRDTLMEYFNVRIPTSQWTTLEINDLIKQNSAK